MKRDHALAKQRGRNLPQMRGARMLTDGGLETTLVFHQGLPLTHFASFPLLESAEGRSRLTDYYRGYARIAKDNRFGFIFEAPTWRANPDWAAQLGYGRDALDALNLAAIDLLSAVRDEVGLPNGTAVVSGCIGPRGDGYSPDRTLGVAEARRYHAAQIDSFRRANADLVTALTIGSVEEAAGIILAAGDASMPVVVSFTVEADGCLPCGKSLRDAVVETDRMTGRIAAYYMVNCAHPSHFSALFSPGVRWQERLGGIRANASNKSHAELDCATVLDEGDPEDLADCYARFTAMLPHLTVLGGCCGTDTRHVAAIAARCADCMMAVPPVDTHAA